MDRTGFGPARARTRRDRPTRPVPCDGQHRFELSFPCPPPIDLRRNRFPVLLHLDRGASPLLAIVSPNLLKTSTNSPVISDLWQSVAEKLRLGLRIDAIRSHFALTRVAIAARGSDRGRRGSSCAGPRGQRIMAGIAATALGAQTGSSLACHFGPGPRM